MAALFGLEALLGEPGDDDAAAAAAGRAWEAEDEPGDCPDEPPAEELPPRRLTLRDLAQEPWEELFGTMEAGHGAGLVVQVSIAATSEALVHQQLHCFVEQLIRGGLDPRLVRASPVSCRGGAQPAARASLKPPATETVRPPPCPSPCPMPPMAGARDRGKRFRAPLKRGANRAAQWWRRGGGPADARRARRHGLHPGLLPPRDRPGRRPRARRRPPDQGVWAAQWVGGIQRQTAGSDRQRGASARARAPPRWNCCAAPTPSSRP